MNTPQEQIELTKEWLRVQEMCFKERFNHPLKCVKFNGEEMRLMPAFDLEAGSYEFALAIVYRLRMRLQISGPRITEEEFNAEYDAACDKDADAIRSSSTKEQS